MSSQGRPPKIKDPEHLWSLFCEYKKYIKSNPFKVKDWVGKDAEMVYREKEKPLTIEGFENYVSDKGVIGDLSHYFANTRGRYKRFLTICSRIKREVREDQIAGGMAGLYNPSITQRLNNLVDKVETTVIEQPLFNLEGDNEEDDDE